MEQTGWILLIVMALQVATASGVYQILSILGS